MTSLVFLPHRFLLFTGGLGFTAALSEEFEEVTVIVSEMMADHSGSTMEADAAKPSSASSRICTPPPPDMPCPTAENWCYTQVCSDLYSMIVAVSLVAVGAVCNVVRSCLPS